MVEWARVTRLYVSNYLRYWVPVRRRTRPARDYIRPVGVFKQNRAAIHYYVAIRATFSECTLSVTITQVASPQPGRAGFYAVSPP
jgi:hypothetical protein